MPSREETSRAASPVVIHRVKQQPAISMGNRFESLAFNKLFQSVAAELFGHFRYSGWAVLFVDASVHNLNDAPGKLHVLRLSQLFLSLDDSLAIRCISFLLISQGQILYV